MTSAAMYGCETTPINDSCMRSYRTAVVDTIAFNTKRRSADLTFAFCSKGTDVDPETEVLVRRVMAMRRAVARSERLEKAHQKGVSALQATE